MEFNLDTLKALIDEKRKELSELESAYNVMLKFSAQTPKSESVVTQSTTLADTDVINLDEIILPEAEMSPRKKTLKDDIMELVAKFGSQEFTVNHVFALMKKFGIGGEAKTLKNRVSMIVKNLSEEGLIILVEKGKGSAPNIYKAKEDKEEVESER